MQLFFQNLSAGMEFLPRLSLTGIIEICIISWMTYAFLTWVMDTKAWILLRGLLLIVAFAPSFIWTPYSGCSVRSRP